MAKANGLGLPLVKLHTEETHQVRIGGVAESQPAGLNRLVDRLADCSVRNFLQFSSHGLRNPDVAELLLEKLQSSDTGEIENR